MITFCVQRLQKQPQLIFYGSSLCTEPFASGFFFSTCLQNLDQWSLRKSWLELQLMIKQVSKEVSHNSSFLSRIVWARKSNSIDLILS